MHQVLNVGGELRCETYSVKAYRLADHYPWAGLGVAWVIGAPVRACLSLYVPGLRTGCAMVVKLPNHRTVTRRTITMFA